MRQTRSNPLTVIDKIKEVIDRHLRPGKITNYADTEQTYDLRRDLGEGGHLQLWPHYEECIIEIMIKLGINHELIIELFNLLKKERKTLRQQYEVKLEKMSAEDRKEHEQLQKTVREEAQKYLKQVLGEEALDQNQLNNVVLGVQDPLPENNEAIPEEALHEPQQNHKNLYAEVENYPQETLHAEVLHQNQENNVVLGVQDPLQENDEAIPEDAPNQHQQNHKNLRAKVENHLEKTLAKVLNQSSKNIEDLLDKSLILLEETLLTEAKHHTKKTNKAQEAKVLNELQGILIDMALFDSREENQKTLFAQALRQNQEKNKDLIAEFVTKYQKTLLIKFQDVVRKDNDPQPKSKSQPKRSNNEPGPEYDTPKPSQTSNLDINEGDTEEIRTKIKALGENILKLVGYNKFEMIRIVIETVIKIIMFRY